MLEVKKRKSQRSLLLPAKETCLQKKETENHHTAQNFLSINPEEWEAGSQPNTWMCMFMRALFTKAGRWTRPKGPSMPREKRERSQTEEVTYGVIFMTYPEQANPERQKSGWWLPGLRGQETAG